MKKKSGALVITLVIPCSGRAIDAERITNEIWNAFDIPDTEVVTELSGDFAKALLQAGSEEAEDRNHSKTWGFVDLEIQ